MKALEGIDTTVIDHALELSKRLAPLPWGSCVWVCGSLGSEGVTWGEADRNTYPNRREMAAGGWIAIYERTEVDADGSDVDEIAEEIYGDLQGADDILRGVTLCYREAAS